jgi:hypothetical protein
VPCWEKRTTTQVVDEDVNALHFRLRLATFCALSFVFLCDDDMIGWYCRTR